MRASLVVQGPSEDIPAFTTRLNEELAKLGDSVRQVHLAAGIHEVTIAGRLSLPRVLNSILILHEDRPSA
jgi:hypothetical protein